MRSVVACGVLAGCLLLPMTASAYEMKRNNEGHPIRWAQSSIHLTVDEKFVEHFGREETEWAAEVAANAWSGLSGVPSVNVSLGTLPDFEEQRRNNGIYLLDAWVNEAEQLALTYTSSTPAGHVVGADIVVNGEMAFGVLDSAGTPSGKYDLAAVLTHEMGHVLGLAESQDEDATMHPDIGPGEIFQRSLAADDRDGVQAVYAEEFPQAAACAYQPGPTKPLREVAVTVGLFALLFGQTHRRFGTRTASGKDDSY